MNKKARILLVLLLLLVGVVGCSNKKPPKTEKESEVVPVQIEQVKEGLIDASSGIVGKFAPKETAQIAPKVSGKIKQINVKLGQVVQLGDVLFSLDQSDLQNSVDQAEASYQVALANLKQAQTSSSQGIDQANSGLVQAKNAVTQAEQTYKEAKLNADRIQALFNAGAVSTVDLEKAQTSFKNAEFALQNAKVTYENAQKTVVYSSKKTAVEVAQASVQQAKVNLDHARDQLVNGKVTAPISGVISNVNGSTGQMASPQAPVVTIVRIDPIVVKANLSESEVTSVKVGMPVTITVPATGTKLDSKITAVSPVMDQQLKAYPIEIEIPNVDKKYKSDLVVNVSVHGIGGRKEKALVVSRSAVFEEQGKKFVYKVKNDIAKKVEVKIGIETSNQVEIISGVIAQETIVVKGQTLLHDGVKVKDQKKE